MLPFPKRRANDEEHELDDADLVVVEEAPVSLSGRRHLAAAPAAPASEADLAVTVNRPRRHTPPSRRMLDESVEHDVAGECLASIAAEVGAPHPSSSRMAISTSSIRASMERSLATSYTMPPPSAQPASGSRLPAVTSPPFVRTTTAPRGGASVASVPGVRESTPPPSAFLRRSTPGLGVAPSYPATSSLTGSSSSAPLATASSVAPVALSPHAEPTVIVVRERPKAAWAIASAAIGAVCAVIAMQLVTSDDRAAGPAAASQAVATTTIATATLPAPPPVTAPAVPAVLAAPAVSATPASPASPATLAPAASPATTAAAAAAATGAVVKFGEDQGVAIKAVPAGSASAKATGAHAPAGSARPAGKPSARPTLGPSLPDGSIGLGGRADGKGATSSQAAPGSNAASSAVATAASPAPAPAPEPAKKRVLTPEQQVAEAQLKASMK